MRVLALCCVLSLIGCTGSVHEEGFSATALDAFLYSAHSNTVMTENDDGVAERMRRDWIAIALAEHAMCARGYIIDTRRFVPDVVGPFGNGGDILYAGRCLAEIPPSPPPVVEEILEK
jgi:hypothetical protein